jgi:hypothetical protein
MLGKVLTVIAPKGAGRLLTILVFATLVAGSANATDSAPDQWHTVYDGGVRTVSDGATREAGLTGGSQTAVPGVPAVECSARTPLKVTCRSAG